MEHSVDSLASARGPRFRRRSPVHLAEVTVKASSGPSAVGMARRALDGLDTHLTPEMLASVRLLVTELVTNSIRHARLSDHDQVAVTVRMNDDVVRVEVGDPGEGFESPAPHSGDLAVEGGWGLYLVDRIADRWGTSRDRGATVWLELDLNPVPQTA